MENIHILGVDLTKRTFAGCCCNQVEMSVVVQSRNVPLSGVGAWLCSAETSYIEALNSHAGVTILQRVMQVSGRSPSPV